jgi:glucose/arabinose dehydrogenase
MPHRAARHVAGMLLIAATLNACGVLDAGGDGNGGGPVEGVPGASTDRPAITATSAPALELPAGSVTTVATGLRIPWALAFLPDGTALVTERGNGVKMLDEAAGFDTSGGPRIMSVTPAGRVTEVQRLTEVDTSLGEGGLLGLAVSPKYATDKWVYVYYSAANDNRIARLRLGQPPEPILTGIPVSGQAGDARYHQGGRLAFGPDGMLYASVGETYWDSQIAQDRASLGGKILRMTPEGKPAPRNPFPNSVVWSYGHRNVQGLAWDKQGRMYASELGSKTYDELNVIEPGRNYGWPVVEGFGTDPQYTNPIATWNPTSIASPSGIAVLGDHIYVACLRGQTLYRLDLDGRNARKLVSDRGRLRAIAVAPDGSLWVTTSNRDQVGQEDRLPQTPEGDRILRIAVG